MCLPLINVQRNHLENIHMLGIIHVLRKKESSSFLPVHLIQTHICTFMTVQVVFKQRINKLADEGETARSEGYSLFLQESGVAPSTQEAVINTCNSSSKGADTCFWPLSKSSNMNIVHTDLQVHSHTHK